MWNQQLQNAEQDDSNAKTISQNGQHRASDKDSMSAHRQRHHH